MSILQFAPIKERRAFQCTQCERQDFWLLDDGSIECRGCNSILASLRHYDKKTHQLMRTEET